MKNITIWGCRGSCPVSGSDYIKYGGNTSCVTVTLPNDRTLIFDAGTGLRPFAHAFNICTDLFFCFTHYHWDHIQGFPFFPLLYSCGSTFHLYAPGSKKMYDSILGQINSIHFPVDDSAIQATIKRVSNLSEMSSTLGVTLTTISANHFDYTVGYRLDSGSQSMVFLPDNELHEVGPENTTFNEFVDFCQDVDVLIHDCQFLPSDFPQKRDWGHSQLYDVLTLAHQANVKKLVLFHHDPARTDTDIDAIHTLATDWIATQGSSIECVPAFDGLQIMCD